MTQLLTRALLASIPLYLFPVVALASSAEGDILDLTQADIGIAALAIFVLAYIVVMSEEFTHLRKSKPVILAAGVIWGMIAYVYSGTGDSHSVEMALRHNLLEFSELFLFLLAAMTYVNAMDERQVFEALRARLVRRGFGYRSLFWLTGLLAFFLSPIIDNLTTALVMCAVLMAVGKDNTRFVGLGCVNIVVAANAGGAFSPFGDITTLMVWQKGLVDFDMFFLLFMPSLVNFLVPAAIMHFAIPAGKPAADDKIVTMRRGGTRIMLLFACTILTAVSFHNFLHLPPFLGMMTGLAYLQFFSYYLKKTRATMARSGAFGGVGEIAMGDASEEQNVMTSSAAWHVPSGIPCCSFTAWCCVSVDLALSVTWRWPRPDVYRIWPNLCQYCCRCHVRHRGQYPGDVRRTEHEPGHGTGAMAAGHPDGRRWRQYVIYRFSGRGGPDGAVARQVHILRSHEVDAGHYSWLRRQHHGAHVDQRRYIFNTCSHWLGSTMQVISFSRRRHTLLPPQAFSMAASRSVCAWHSASLALITGSGSRSAVKR